jgi:hypothetical protein
MDNKKSNAYGIASLVVGILGLMFCWFPVLGTGISILAIYFANMQKKIIDNGYSMVGLILGIIGSVISILILLMFTLTLLISGSFN